VNQPEEVAAPVNVTAQEAAHILGGWSSRSVYRYGAYLGARRFGRSVRFDREAVLKVAFEGLPLDARPAPPRTSRAILPLGKYRKEGA
jgi:hypothetical protein